MQTKRETGAFTLEDLYRAVDVLRTNDVPPCTCDRCGAKFYVINPDLENANLDLRDCGGHSASVPASKKPKKKKRKKGR